MFVMVPLQVYIGKKTQMLQRALLKTRDERLGIVNEVYNYNITNVYMYTNTWSAGRCLARSKW